MIVEIHQMTVQSLGLAQAIEVVLKHENDNTFVLEKLTSALIDQLDDIDVKLQGLRSAEARP